VPALAGRPAFPDPVADACNALKAWSGDETKPVSLTYILELSPADFAAKSIPMDKADPAPLYANISKALPKLAASIDAADAAVPFTGSGLPTDSNDQTVIWLTKTKLVTVKVTSTTPAGALSLAGSTTIVVPADGEYALPMPRSVLFGKESMSLAVDDSGAVTSVGYTRQNGSASAVNALTGALTPSDEAKANILKGQADLIAQQTRLVQCEADSSTCK